MWRATSVAEAIELAEVEASDYEGEPDVDGRATGPKYLGLAQGYAMATESDSVSSADEIFSLVRGSTLKPQAYLDAFFDTGSERQTKLKPRSKKNRERKSSRPEQIDCSASPPFDEDRMTFPRKATPARPWRRCSHCLGHPDRWDSPVTSCRSLGNRDRVISCCVGVVSEVFADIDQDRAAKACALLLRISNDSIQALEAF